MHNKENENFMTSIQHALGLNIRTRCAELTVLLDRGTLLELHTLFPVLIDNIFGPQGTVGWGLRNITEDSNGFRELQHFLSPCGPVFKLIYTLLKDPNIKYDFPITFMPSKIRQYLENSHMHPFYTELINTNPQTKQAVSLFLNPFDYYMFHFAFHLINPWQQRAGSAVNSWNTVYYVLCCDYIIYFLPTSPTFIIHPVIYYNGKNPLQAIKCNFQEQQPKNSGLINRKNLTKIKEDPSFQQNLDIHHPRNDIWRSETVLTVFTDMWLQSNQVNDASNLNASTMGLLHHNELPTGEYMRIVRVLIKQLHSFSASAKADDTHLAELKKIAIPMIQGKFYVFLRSLIHSWPLDGSFRLVLELWLTYIQPWRYPPNNLVKYLNKKENNTDVEDVAIGTQPAVDREFLQFIAENLLAYVVILQQLLPRFGRADLVSPKMSLMLYRIAKVFDQPNLPNFLKEVEQCVDGNNQDITKFNSNQWNSSLPSLSPTTGWSSLNMSPIMPTHKKSASPILNNSSFLNATPADRKWSSIIKQKILELEGPSFGYKPLFSEPPSDEVKHLILQIKRSINIAQELVRRKEEEEDELYSGFWGQLKYFLNGPTLTDEFTLKDRQKVPMYLQVARQNLCDMFNIDTELSEPNPVTQANISNGNGLDMNKDFKFLTPERVRERIKHIRYEGDPDLHPVRSTELTFLVKIFHELTVFINEKYGANFYQAYHNSTIIGRIWRQILCPPIVIFKYDKTKPGSPRIGKNLPPRVSLRFMACYKFWSYLLFGYAITRMCGYSLQTYFCLIWCLFIVYTFFKALWKDQVPARHNYPTQGFCNISFNDSF